MCTTADLLLMSGCSAMLGWCTFQSLELQQKLLAEESMKKRHELRANFEEMLKDIRSQMGEQDEEVSYGDAILRLWRRRRYGYTLQRNRI